MALAPRMLQVEKVVGTFICPSNSILQGDMQSNGFAKIMLYDILEYLSVVHPGSQPRQYVDDLRLAAHGQAQQAVPVIVKATADL
eukprot:1611465-Lingulodinium_polyedra.AAC.1